MNILLDVPFEFTRKRLSEGRTGDDRDYLKGQTDIHEQDLEFQGRVRNIYHSLLNDVENLSIVDCADNKGEMHEPKIIFNNLLQLISAHLK